MKRLLVVSLVGLLAVGMAQRFSVEGSAGFYTGLSGQLGVVVEDLPGLPLGFRLGVGYAATDALDDNYDVGGGTKWGDLKKNLELNEWGQNITLSLDVLYTLAELQGIKVAPYAGVRYNLFSGGYTDPKNKTTVKAATLWSDSFGLGLGVRATYALAPNLSLVGDIGADYYFKNCITGTVEYDDGTKDSRPVCPNDTDYDEANKLVTQPDGFVLKLRMGVAYRF